MKSVSKLVSCWCSVTGSVSFLGSVREGSYCFHVYLVLRDTLDLNKTLVSRLQSGGDLGDVGYDTLLLSVWYYGCFQSMQHVCVFEVEGSILLRCWYIETFIRQEQGRWLDKRVQRWRSWYDTSLWTLYTQTSWLWAVVWCKVRRQMGFLLFMIPELLREVCILKVCLIHLCGLIIWRIYKVWLLFVLEVCKAFGALMYAVLFERIIRSSRNTMIKRISFPKLFIVEL